MTFYNRNYHRLFRKMLLGLCRGKMRRNVFRCIYCYTTSFAVILFYGETLYYINEWLSCDVSPSYPFHIIQFSRGKTPETVIFWFTVKKWVYRFRQSVYRQKNKYRLPLKVYREVAFPSKKYREENNYRLPLKLYREVAFPSKKDREAALPPKNYRESTLPPNVYHI